MILDGLPAYFGNNALQAEVLSRSFFLN